MSEETKIERLRKEIVDICQKVNKRIRELGDVDIMTYRSDPTIKRHQDYICKLYRGAVRSCKTYGEASEICNIFMSEPGCLTQLMLSEEVACFQEVDEEE
ncbi:MAG: hypothetical protein L6M37_00125 [Candidatus Methylarchaceae archaeon HK02M1]|nr:hypothetical protein [Candidatus Methylarchaceae archaeon HK02M1]